MAASRQDFELELGRLLDAAMANGKQSVDISAGELHRHVGGYPDQRGDHRMPDCCLVMRGRMGTSDEIIKTPPSGQGASLTIRYKL